MLQHTLGCMEPYLNLAGLDTKQPVLSPLTHSAPNGGVSPLVAISIIVRSSVKQAANTGTMRTAVSYVTTGVLLMTGA
jgi:hypothetical protein